VPGHVLVETGLIDARFPVQYVIRPMSHENHENHDCRGYAGQVASGCSGLATR
jgi:bifunctional enzyme CysN/CysC